MFILDSALSVTEYLLKNGYSVSQERLEMLKWRCSPEAKKMYTDEENRIFYQSLKSGNLIVLDAIRVEKQKRIDAWLLRHTRSSGCFLILLLIPILLMTSCSLLSNKLKLKSDPVIFDINSVQDTQRTYQLKTDQTIKIENEKPIEFTTDWFLIHNDQIKKQNENQDTILKLTQIIDDMKTEEERKEKIKIQGTIISAVILVIFLIIYIIITLRKK